MFRKRTCIVDTVYSLLLYLLISDIKSIKKTTFYIGSTILEFSSVLPNVITLTNKDFITTDKNKLNGLRKKYRRELLKIYFSDVYAQDHLAFAPLFIGWNRYTLLEDAPSVYKRYKEVKFLKPLLIKPWKTRLFFDLYAGPTYGKYLGTNKFCKKILYTEKSDISSDLFKGKKASYVNLFELWENSDVVKKDYIKKVYSIDKDLLDRFCDKKVIIFSQPLQEDCGLTDEEMVDVYSPYIETYKPMGVVIKVHPRDKFDYVKYFPSVSVVCNKAPMQLLNLMGLVFDVAITVCSTAVSAMPKETQIIWIGTGVNEKIVKVYGNIN